MGWYTIDLESMLVAGVRDHGGKWFPLWDLPPGLRHGNTVHVCVLDGLAVIGGPDGLTALRRALVVHSGAEAA